MVVAGKCGIWLVGSSHGLCENSFKRFPPSAPGGAIVLCGGFLHFVHEMTLAYEFCRFTTKAFCPKSLFRASQDWRNQHTASLGGAGGPFLHRKPAWHSEPRGASGKTGQDVGKATRSLPLGLLCWASTAQLLLGLWDSRLGKNQGETLAKLSRTAAFCFTVLNGNWISFPEHVWI